MAITPVANPFFRRCKVFDFDTVRHILPLRLLSSDAPEMFDVNVLFTTSTESVMLVKTTSKKAPIFVCRANGLI